MLYEKGIESDCTMGLHEGTGVARLRSDALYLHGLLWGSAYELPRDRLCCRGVGRGKRGDLDLHEIAHHHVADEESAAG